METGFDGTFVIPWSHSWIDGQRNPPEDALEPGAVWAWQGTALRVDGSYSVLGLRDRRVRRKAPLAEAFPGDDLLRGSFVVTDGLLHYAIARIETRMGQPDLLMFQGRPPPRDRRLWVIDCTYADPLAKSGPHQAGIGEGALVDTPQGARPVETLQPGDLLHTHAGPQPVIWAGRREIGAAEMYLSPSLRPYRDAGANVLFGPSQAVLMDAAALQALFGVPRALVAVRDMPEGCGFARDLVVDTVRLWHVLLPRHAMLRVNGHWVDSFVPDKPALDRLGPSQRLQVQHALDRRAVPSGNGWPAPFRRLTKAEATIALTRAA